MNQYRKTIAAVVTGLLGWGGVVVLSEPAAVTASEWIALGVALATALGVYAIPNEKSLPEVNQRFRDLGVVQPDTRLKGDDGKITPGARLKAIEDRIAAMLSRQPPEAGQANLVGALWAIFLLLAIIVLLRVLGVL